MKCLLCGAMLALFLANGCPRGPTDEVPTGPVTAQITISATSGEAPLTVEVSAAESTSTTVGELAYGWDFGDGSTADTVEATHTYDAVSTYTIVLHVTDAEGNLGTATVNVHVGTIPIAVILVDKNIGRLPTTIEFDGSESRCDSGVINEYYWDFGDGSEVDRQSAPTHTYEQAGAYTVTLRVVAANGLEDSVTTRIAAGETGGSIEMDPLHRASFPGWGESTDEYMFEAWFKADATGGQLFSYADGLLSVMVYPASDVVEVHVISDRRWATVLGLCDQWHHIAVVFDRTVLPATATVYLDGEYLLQVPEGGANDDVPFDPWWWEEPNWWHLHAGDGFTGKIAEVRWWSQPVSLDNRWSRLDPSTPNLCDYWRLDECSGRHLINQCGSNGYYVRIWNGEMCEPVWSPDGPPVTSE